MARLHLRRMCGGIAILLVSTAVAWSQRDAADSPGPISIARVRPQAVTGEESVLRSESILVVIPARVTTEQGTSVTDLRRENFSVTENNVLQRIAHFSLDDAPVSVGLLLDVSGSMRPKMRMAAQAAAAFFRTSNPEDEFFLVEFSDRAKIRVPFTFDTDEVYSRIQHTHPFGRTALLDAVYLALKQMKKARNERKALVIFSEGGDNWSRHSAREVKRALLETDVQVYAMGIPAEDGTEATTVEELNGPRLLDELAGQSGGRYYDAERLQDLPAISAQIGNELRNEYLLGYYPEPIPRDGKYHRVHVQLQVQGTAGHLRADYRQDTTLRSSRLTYQRKPKLTGR